MNDEISKVIVRIVSQSNEPMGTREIEQAVSRKIRDATRAKIIYRLMNLRAEGKIMGRNIVSGEGKGIWVWWKPGTFS